MAVAAGRARGGATRAPLAFPPLMLPFRPCLQFQVRQAALQCVQTVIKLANRRSLNRYWLSFLPEWHSEYTPPPKQQKESPKAKGTGELPVAPPLSSGPGGGMHSLLTSLERELVPQTRVCVLQLMLSLFDGAKSFLMSAGGSMQPATLCR